MIELFESVCVVLHVATQAPTKAHDVFQVFFLKENVKAYYVKHHRYVILLSDQLALFFCTVITNSFLDGSREMPTGQRCYVKLVNIELSSDQL